MSFLRASTYELSREEVNAARAEGMARPREGPKVGRWVGPGLDTIARQMGGTEHGQ
jgi:hypothetical protein